eukprot:COSAG01_NODE_75862_length_192_cov_30.107527_1_plen_22_part_01
MSDQDRFIPYHTVYTDHASVFA